MLDVLAQPALWQALSTSLRIAIAAGLLSVTLTMMLLWSSRELRSRQRPLAGQAMELSGMLILAMPGIVLATGSSCCSITLSRCRSPPTASSSSLMP
ncbi:thiamin ABC transporter transmembrane protein [Klebsiella pneumoniae]|uniref:Thiamin ABC transporter transmembrane protein n=1 Tax=Klebsiella pneumoniae TaxID=573 RepID=A0A2X3GVD0_KLEPN|nr:thiamin ABC transporter transmembrane protein [Klebsiella pneumoniae]